MPHLDVARPSTAVDFPRALCYKHVTVGSSGYSVCAEQERSTLTMPTSLGQNETLDRVAQLLSSTTRAMALTGAGISVDSGLPQFRGVQGLWTKYDPAEYATIDAFMADPAKVWKMMVELGRQIAEAQPNPAHYGLAELERMGHISVVVTQNIDGLHQRAGSRNVIEFHGNTNRLSCIECFRTYPADEISLEHLPPLCLCGGVLKPDVVLYGETIPPQAAAMAHTAAGECELMMVVGTSAETVPASNLPRTAKSGGATIVEINISPTMLTGSTTDYFIESSSSDIVPDLVARVKALELR